MTPTRAALLNQVAQAIIESGYADLEQRYIYTPRQIQMSVIASDPRIDCSPYSAERAALVRDAMQQYKVSRENARLMIYRARKMREERHADT